MFKESERGPAAPDQTNCSNSSAPGGPDAAADSVGGPAGHTDRSATHEHAAAAAAHQSRHRRRDDPAATAAGKKRLEPSMKWKVLEDSRVSQDDGQLVGTAGEAPTAPTAPAAARKPGDADKQARVKSSAAGRTTNRESVLRAAIYSISFDLS